ncbi:MAG TPA: hypothetical protein VNR64_06680 [Vicinamibacterales bacterium]|nr:hypothetical protein [Vicinamibacterales bacterium]
MTLRAARLEVVIPCILIVACGGNPSAPTQSTGGANSGSSGGACRRFPATATITVQSAAAGTRTSPATCAWDSGLHQLKCTISVTSGGPLCTTTVTTYNSTADFVDEIQVIPPRLLRTSEIETASGAAACGAGAIQNITYVYDTQRRVTEVLNGSVSTLYSAWDSAGRPTQGTVSSGAPVTIVYDSSGRTQTQTVGTGAAAVVTATTFDTTGTPIKIVTQDAGVSTTTTTQVNSTTQVCK